MSDSFHNIEVRPPAPTEFHAYVQMKDLNDGMKFATRLAVDRARRDGNNPRNGSVQIYFDDNGVGAKWIKDRE
jgi:catechol-2,3-dioxygenase